MVYQTRTKPTSPNSVEELEWKIKPERRKSGQVVLWFYPQYLLVLGSFCSKLKQPFALFNTQYPTCVYAEVFILYIYLALILPGKALRTISYLQL